MFTTQLLVPGDVITKTCTIDLVATGDHVAADLSISDADWTARLSGRPHRPSSSRRPSSPWTVRPPRTVTEADDTGATDEIEAVISVTFTGDSATNASQDLTATLDTVTVSAVQDHDAVLTCPPPQQPSRPEVERRDVADPGRVGVAACSPGW